MFDVRYATCCMSYVSLQTYGVQHAVFGIVCVRYSICYFLCNILQCIYAKQTKIFFFSILILKTWQNWCRTCLEWKEQSTSRWTNRSVSFRTILRKDPEHDYHNDQHWLLKWSHFMTPPLSPRQVLFYPGLWMHDSADVTPHQVSSFQKDLNNGTVLINPRSLPKTIMSHCYFVCFSLCVSSIYLRHGITDFKILNKYFIITVFHKTGWQSYYQNFCYCCQKRGFFSLQS